MPPAKKATQVVEVDPEVEVAEPQDEAPEVKAKSSTKQEAKSKSVHDLIREIDPDHTDDDPVNKYDIITNSDGTIHSVKRPIRDFRV